jgi:hypothetical protein
MLEMVAITLDGALAGVAIGAGKESHSAPHTVGWVRSRSARQSIVSKSVRHTASTSNANPRKRPRIP